MAPQFGKHTDDIMKSGPRAMARSRRLGDISRKCMVRCMNQQDRYGRLCLYGEMLPGAIEGVL